MKITSVLEIAAALLSVYFGLQLLAQVASWVGWHYIDSWVKERKFKELLGWTYRWRIGKYTACFSVSLFALAWLRGWIWL